MEEAIAAQKDLKAYNPQITRASVLDSVTAATNMAQLHRETAQTYADLSRGYSDASTLAKKFYKLSRGWRQTNQCIDEMVNILSKSEKLMDTDIKSQNLMFSSRILKLRDQIIKVENILGINVEWQFELQSYIDRFQHLFEESSRGLPFNYIDMQACHQSAASHFDKIVEAIRDYTPHHAGALRSGETVHSVWLDAHKQKESMINHLKSLALHAQEARTQDQLADTLKTHIDTSSQAGVPKTETTPPSPR